MSLNLDAKRPLFNQRLIGSFFASCAVAIAITSPAQAFNFTTGDVGGSCGNLVDSFNYYTGFGGQKLPSCVTSDGFHLIAKGGDLQARRDGSITCVGITDMDWSNLVGICITGVISPCNGNTGEGEIGSQEALHLLLPNGAAVLESLDLRFRFAWDTPANVVFELVALLSDQSQTTGTLTFTQNNGAVWNWMGNTQTITSVSGGYRLINPFADTSIASVKLTAPDLSGKYGYVDTKYGLIGAEARPTAAVPEPNTMAGMALAGGLALLKRKGRR